MTEPAAPAPQGATPLRPPQPWPPQQAVPPPWPGRQPSPPQWPAQQVGAAWQPPAPAPRRDSTRVIAIVALVLSGITVVWMALTTLVPLLFFGLFASFAGEGFDDGTMFPSVSTSFGGEVTPSGDGSVAGATLAAAVTRLAKDDGMEPAGPLSCDPVPRVAGGVSVLCRAADPAWFGIVRFTSTDGSFQLITVGADGDPIP